MMTIEEIRTGKEGQTFDLKSILIDPKALAIPIVAMANADGGLLAIGISDKTRRIEGVNQYAEKLNELLRVPFDFCIPSIPVKCSYMDCTDQHGNENRILLMDIPASMFLHTNQADEALSMVPRLMTLTWMPLLTMPSCWDMESRQWSTCARTTTL